MSVTWKNAASGLWNTATLWAGGVVPGTNETAVLIAGTYTVTAIAVAAGDVTIDAGVTLAVSDNTAFTENGSTVLNASTLALQSTGDNTDFVVASSTLTLNGGGQFDLSDAASNRIIASVAGNTLVNTGNTIAGSGQFGADSGLGLDNQGSGQILSTGTAGLTIDLGGGQTLTNAGLIADTGSGGLTFSNTIVDNVAGTLEAQSAAGVLYLAGATVRGGDLAALQGGSIQEPAGEVATLDGSTVAITISGKLQENDGATMSVLGTVNNQGTIAQESAGNNTDVALFGGTVTLSGSGTVAMDDRITNRIFASQNGDTLVNINNTIAGSGQIGADTGMGLTNGVAGLIDSTGAAGMTIDLGGGQTLTNSGTIAVTGTGLLTVDSPIAGTGMLNIGAGATLAANGAVAGGTAVFNGGGLLVVGAAPGFDAVVQGFAPGDTIDIVSAPYGTADVASLEAGNTLEIITPDNGSFGVPLNAEQDFGNIQFAASAGVAGGTQVTIACFAAGTLIHTPQGEVPVEELRPGDLVVSALDGGVAPIRWVGYRRIEPSRHARPADVQPVRVHAHAFGAGRPHSQLLLSPDHAVYFAGVLIPVRYLVNGRTVVQEAVASITYWHVELDYHDVVLAQGLAVESYLDTGNRSAFAGAGVTDAHPDFSRQVWADAACAPLLTEGPQLATAQRYLLVQAGRLGHRRTPEPGLRVFAAGQALEPQWHGVNICTIDLPDGASRIRLHSRTAVPAWTMPGNCDGRRLGVAVTRLRLRGHEISVRPQDDGWHAVEDGWRWTDGDAALTVSPGRLEIMIAPMLSYWEQEADDWCVGEGGHPSQRLPAVAIAAAGN